MVYIRKADKYIYMKVVAFPGDLWALGKPVWSATHTMGPLLIGHCLRGSGLSYMTKL